jgi:hypothetical protein
MSSATSFNYLVNVLLMMLLTMAFLAVTINANPIVSSTTGGDQQQQQQQRPTTTTDREEHIMLLQAIALN